MSYEPKAKTAQAAPQVTADEIIAAAKAEAANILAAAMAGAQFAQQAPAAPAPPPSAAEKAMPNVRPRRVWITLSENPNIPRGGHFFGVNGASFLLKPGKKASVPEGLLDVLENAVEGYPVVDPDTLIITEWRERLRYPYTNHGFVDAK